MSSNYGQSTNTHDSLKSLLTSMSMTDCRRLSMLILRKWVLIMPKGEHSNKLIEMTELHHILRSPLNNRQIELTLILL